ncbi:MAG: Nif3-like dinuclear metal center hexameric protein, partial [Phycisphaerae bacterium]|nr:Nif3-like dinuclear metal center hexameric protein [Phycisphaerae bacterium]
FVPEGATERVRSAMAGVGAGSIGAYTMCSFASMGAGTFLGGAGSNPSVGQAGRLEYVAEIRLEMVCDGPALPAVLAALRGSHPYEEPAIDVYALSDQPRRDTGAGRVVTLDAPLALDALAERIARRAGLAAQAGAVRVAGTGEARRIAVIPGAGASLIGTARAAGCDTIVTGEMKHHEVLAATAAGLGVVLAGHTETERGYLPVLAARLAGLWPGVRAVVSRADGPPTRAA